MRYEDLVAAPETVLTGVCGLIGEAFEPGMLDTTRTGKDVSSPNEVWKAGNAGAIDRSRTQLWCREPDLKLQRVLTYTCCTGIQAFGYPSPETPTSTVRAYPLGLHTAEAHEGTMLRAAAQGMQFREAERPSIGAELVLLPGGGGPRRAIFRTLWTFAALLLARLAQDLNTYYLRPDPDRTGWTGHLSLALFQPLVEPYPLASIKALLTPRPTFPARTAAPPPPSSGSRSGKGRSAAP